MWVLAVLSLLVFWISDGGSAIVIPLGPVFAIWCWRLTAQPLKSLAHRDSPAATEMWARAYLALALASLSVPAVILT
jgi:hypothetical protein